jgi:two-component system, NarL family, sensor histidine kinase UhpB
MPLVSILWRVFAVNALVFGVALMVLVISPATVHDPIRTTELEVLVVGVVVMLLIDLLLLALVLAPVRRLGRLMRDVDPLRPGVRASVGPWASSEAASLARAFNGMLDRLEAERRESARRELAAQEAERSRVARELHDEVGQALTAIALRAESAIKDGASQPQALEDIVDVVHASLSDVRRITRELRPEALEDLGLTDALISLCLRLERQGPMRILRNLSSDRPKLDPEVELVVYRVAQEALTNALRHSEATQVDVGLQAASAGVELTVSDNGRGVAGEPHGGGGLSGMRERALLIDARLATASTPGGGFTVRLTVPPAPSQR